MEEKQIGFFIRDRRLELGLTQQQLAERLNITDKAVSKWERGLSCPDITLLRTLADALEVSVAELLAGKREDEPPQVPPEVETVVLDTVRYAEDVRRKKRGWRSWLFAVVSGGCLIAEVVLLIVTAALENPATLLAFKCVAFGWAWCFPLLRTRHPVRDFLVLFSLTICPFLWQILPFLEYLWAYGIALLSVGYLWALYFLWRRLMPGRLWMWLGWMCLLGTVLALLINQIVWGAAGVQPDAVSRTVNTLFGGLCFGVCFLLDVLLHRRRAEG